MKKAIIMLVTAMLCITSASAQRKKATASTQNAKWAVLQITDYYDVSEGRDSLFIVDKYNTDNTVFVINKTTGAASIMLGPYKDFNGEKRDKVYSVCQTADGKIYMASDKGVLEWNGQDLNTSKLVWTHVNQDGSFQNSLREPVMRLSPNGKYMAISHQATAVIELPEFKTVTLSYLKSSENLAVDDMGNAWALFGSTLDMAPMGSTEPAQPVKIRDKELGSSQSTSDVKYNPADSTIYVSQGRQIMAYNLGDKTWKRVAQMDGQTPGNFGRMAITPSGDFVLAKADYNDPALTVYKGGLQATPTVTKDAVTNVRDQWGSYCKIKENNRAFSDSQGNIVLLSTHAVTIHNPAGIKGYKSLKGKHLVLKDLK